MSTHKIMSPSCPSPFFSDDATGAAVVGLWMVWAGTHFVAVHTIHSLVWAKLLPDRCSIEHQVQQVIISFLTVLSQGEVNILGYSRNSTR